MSFSRGSLSLFFPLAWPEAEQSRSLFSGGQVGSPRVLPITEVNDALFWDQTAGGFSRELDQSSQTPSIFNRWMQGRASPRAAAARGEGMVRGRVSSPVWGENTPFPALKSRDSMEWGGERDGVGGKACR